jgi:hypothetical protein
MNTAGKYRKTAVRELIRALPAGKPLLQVSPYDLSEGRTCSAGSDNAELISAFFVSMNHCQL